MKNVKKPKKSKKWLKAPEYVRIFKDFLAAKANNPPYDCYDLGKLPVDFVRLMSIWASSELFRHMSKDWRSAASNMDIHLT